MRRPLRNTVVAWAGVSLVACGGDTAESDGATVSAGPSVMIVAPTDGADIEGTEFTVRIESTGLEIVPAGVEGPNSGHHHLFVNHELTPAGETIPAEEGVIHLGAAQTEYTLTDLAPGEYTITVVLGDHLHARMADVEPHAITVTVTGPPDP